MNYTSSKDSLISNLPPTEFQKKLISWKNAMGREINRYVDSLNLSKEAVEDVHSQELAMLQFYTLQNILGFRDNYLEQPSLLDSILADLVMRDDLLWKNSSRYGHLLHGFTMTKHIFDSSNVQHSGDSDIQQGDYTAYDFTEHVQGFLAAKYTDNMLALDGISPFTDSLFTIFKDLSPYRRHLMKHRKAWLELTAGKVAPEIKAINPERDTASTKDLLGKVLYVDI